MKKRPLYEHGLADVLWHIEDARQNGLRKYKRVVSKKRTNKKKRKNGKPMTCAAKIAGWDKAAVRFMRQCQKNLRIRTSTITLEEAAQMDAQSRKAAKKTSGTAVRLKSNLIGVDFGQLLVWKLSSVAHDGIKRYWVLCTCGKAKEIPAVFLLNGRVRDCGHVLRAKRRQQRTRKRQKLERQGRKRAFWKKHWGMVA